ncbi:MAG: aconitase X swivel domain-containing protein [Thermoplasmata archaeon]
MILQGRGISKGFAEGKVVKIEEPISFLGDVDPDTGTAFEDKNIKNSIFVFPGGRGSTVGSYVIYQLKKNSTAPMGMINEKTETIVATGAIISDIPLVDKIQIDLLKDGDKVQINGYEGKVEMKNVFKQPVVTCFLRKDSKILLLKRGEDVGSYRGKWSAVSGYVETESIMDQALIEIEQETGLNADFVNDGQIVRVRYKNKIWEVNPFLFDVKGDIDMNWENVEFKWISPEDIKKMDTVPKLWEAYKNVSG